MLRPSLLARVEQRDLGAVGRINAAEVRAFVQVAMVTCPGKVRFDGCAAVLAGDDVFAVEPKKRTLVLMRPAVFATVTGAIADEMTKSGVQSDSLCRRRV